MTSDPLVSVLMPCYNARESLPWAFGSLLAQTFQDWELVLVDDGSTDRPEEIIEQARDARIRLIRLPENRGRGYARQVALDHARGELVAMLDADDWMYPARLELEVKALRRNEALALVSAGMAIVDASGDLVGVKHVGDGSESGPFTGFECPAPHAPSMFRRSAADGHRFDPRLTSSEDLDFLVRMLQGRRFTILSEPLYVYSELSSVSARKAALAQRTRRVTIRRSLRSSPVHATRKLAESHAKELAFGLGAVLGLDEQFVRRRLRQATEQERLAFSSARDAVESVVRNRFTVN